MQEQLIPIDSFSHPVFESRSGEPELVRKKHVDKVKLIYLIGVTKSNSKRHYFVCDVFASREGWVEQILNIKEFGTNMSSALFEFDRRVEKYSGERERDPARTNTAIPSRGE